VSAFDSISMMAQGALMKHLDHPNVLKCYGAVGRRAAAKLDGEGAGVRRSALILDYAPGGQLRDRMELQGQSDRVRVQRVQEYLEGQQHLS
jgi:hypothetical protein